MAGVRRRDGDRRCHGARCSFPLRIIVRRDPIPLLFGEFDAVRRARCERIIHSSRDTGRIFCGRDAEVGMDADKLRRSLASRWDFVGSIDYAAHIEGAVSMSREMLGKLGA